MENRHIPDISSFINNENKARTLVIGNKVLRMSSTALFNGTHSDLLSISDTTAIKIVERIKYTRKLEFSAKTLNGKEVKVEFLLIHQVKEKNIEIMLIQLILSSI
ncbi:MAG: hypothetical protein IPH96_16235 [Saprospiraceae bacterium]|nr:hypothetical protein [Saprospiraceae bacterium]